MTTDSASVDINQLYKPFHESFIANPYPFYEVARQSAPVFYSEEIDHWVVSRYADIKQIIMDKDTFSVRNTLTPMTPLSEAAQKVLQEGGWRLQPALGNNDRPDHSRFRQNLMRIFTVQMMKDAEPYVRKLANSLVDKIEHQGEAELIDELIFQFPARVVLHMLGFPEEEMPVLIEGGKDRNQFIFGTPSEEQQIAMATNVARLFSRCGELVEKRRQDPGDDFTSTMLTLRDDESGELVFNSDEVTSVLFAFFTAGHETTASLIGNSIRHLLTNRDQWEKICEDPSLIPNAVEESLRFDSAVVGWRRFATQDVEIAGVTIPEGSQVLLLLGSANRDEEVFESPDRFDITRDNAQMHLSFSKGIHTCFGNVLARQEIRVALEVLSARLPGLQLVGDQDFELMPNLVFRTLYDLKVTW